MATTPTGMALLKKKLAAEDFIIELRSIGMPIKVPSDPDWAAYSSTYNLLFPVTPAVVVVPRTLRHIGRAVACARKHGIKVQARCGGHSYASHGNGGSNGAMVVDLRVFQTVYCVSNLSMVNAGIRLGNLAFELFDKGGCCVPQGTCAGVGIGGHFTHGGFGMFSRAWGLAMDRIVGMEVIIADGKHLRTDDNKYPDLFYAMRGAPESFGIIQSFYLHTEFVPHEVCHWTISIPEVLKDVQMAVRAFRHIQDFAHNEDIVDRRLGMNLCFGPGNFAIHGSFLGPYDELKDKILPGLESAFRGNVPITDIHKMTWLESAEFLNMDQNIRINHEEPYDEHSKFFAKSVIIPEPGFSDATLRSFFQYFLNEGANPPVSYFLMMDLYGGPDSQINTKDLDFSAFPHRDACWVAQIYGYVDNDQGFPSQGLDFVNGMAKAMTKGLRRYGAYSNYTDPSLSREQAHKLYYGDELTHILKVLKRKWDPDNVFAGPHTIEP